MSELGSLMIITYAIFTTILLFLKTAITSFREGFYSSLIERICVRNGVDLPKNYWKVKNSDWFVIKKLFDPNL